MPPIDTRLDAADLRTASTPDLLRLILGYPVSGEMDVKNARRSQLNEGIAP